MGIFKPTLQKYPQMRFLQILIEKIVEIQNLNDAKLASLSIFCISRWRPRWPPLQVGGKKDRHEFESVMLFLYQSRMFHLFMIRFG